jgi:hypothetical protein
MIAGDPCIKLSPKTVENKSCHPVSSQKWESKEITIYGGWTGMVATNRDWGRVSRTEKRRNRLAAPSLFESSLLGYF